MKSTVLFSHSFTFEASDICRTGSLTFVILGDCFRPLQKGVRIQIKTKLKTNITSLFILLSDMFHQGGTVGVRFEKVTQTLDTLP